MYFPDKKVIVKSWSVLNTMLPLYYLIGFAIMYLSPESILTDNKYLENICNSISYYIASINIWSYHSPFPEITKIYFTYCWISIPLQTYTIIKNKNYEEQFIIKWNENRKLNHLRLLILVVITTSLVFYSANYAIFDSKPCFVCVNSSRFAQALLGGLIPFVNAGMLALMYWVIKNYKKIF